MSNEIGTLVTAVEVRHEFEVLLADSKITSSTVLD